MLQRTFKQLHRKRFFGRFVLVNVTAVNTFYVNRCPRKITIVLFCSVKRTFRSHTIKGTRQGVGTLLSMHPRATAIVHSRHPRAVHPRGIGMKRAVRVGTKRHIPLSKVVRGRRTSFGATTLAKRDHPQAVHGKRAILTKVVTASQMMQLAMAGPFGRDTLTQVLTVMRRTGRQGTPMRLFVHQFTQVCAPVIAKLTMLVILLPFLCSLKIPTFSCIFES